MQKPDISKLVRQNSIYWLTALVLPILFHYGLAGTRFPWPVVLPLLLLAPMLGSNALLTKAARRDESDGK